MSNEKTSNEPVLLFPMARLEAMAKDPGNIPVEVRAQIDAHPFTKKVFERFAEPAPEIEADAFSLKEATIEALDVSATPEYREGILKVLVDFATDLDIAQSERAQAFLTIKTSAETYWKQLPPPFLRSLSEIEPPYPGINRISWQLGFLKAIVEQYNALKSGAMASTMVETIHKAACQSRLSMAFIRMEGLFSPHSLVPDAVFSTGGSAEKQWDHPLFANEEIEVWAQASVDGFDLLISGKLAQAGDLLVTLGDVHLEISLPDGEYFSYTKTIPHSESNPDQDELFVALIPNDLITLSEED